MLFALALIAAACGGDDETSEAESDGGGEAASGEIVISGSSTVEPISIAVAESFRDVQSDVNVSVSGPGTGDGFKLFCGGETDISDASRQIKTEEADDCAANGIEYVEIKVAVDGIAVMTSAENADVECLAFGDLYAIVGPESTGFGNWSDANDLAVEAGGNGGFPDADLVISAPGTESGTYDSFVEIALEDIADERGQEATTRPDYSSAADDNVILETISTNPTSFGWVGFAYAVNASGVKLVPISSEAGGDCVSPTPETIASNEYPISRDLFIYVNKAKAAESPALVDFVDHYLDYGLDTAAAEVGYVALTEDAKTASRDAWAAR
jgi:phosphate transport system substrate-binding protein